MNKKLVASLLTLGLVFSPITGAITETYATEESTDEEIALKKIEKIENLAKYYDQYKDDNDYRLGDDELRNKLESTLAEAVEYADKGVVSLEDLDDYIKNIQNYMTSLSTNAKENQNNLKINIITSRNLLSNNSSKSESEEYKLLAEKIGQAVEILKKGNLEKIRFENLKKANNDLVNSFLKAREAFADSADYSSIKEEELKELNTELDNEQEGDKNFEKLLKVRQSLLDKDESFRITEAFVKADDEKKEAYENAFKELKDLTDLEENAENQEKITEKINKIKQARKDIDENDSVTVVESDADQKRKDIDKEIRILRDYISEMANVNKIIAGDNFKDKALGDSYNKEIDKAIKLATNVDYTKDIKEFQDTANKLKDLTEKIKAQEKNPGSNKETPSESKFENEKAARAAINKLLENTKAIEIDDFYGSDQKAERDAYLKNREEAKKAHDNKKASLEDLTKAYSDFNKSIEDLSKFLREKLGKLLDDKEFRESENFKKANENLIKYYDELIKKAKEDKEKPSLGANELDNLYKKIVNAKKEINGELSSQARKLKDAINESKLFMNSDPYLKAAVSSNEWRKKAAQNYKSLIESAKLLDKEDKLDSKLGEETLDALTKSKDFIEGKIDETKFKNNYYYYKLKPVLEREEFKSVGQVARDRLKAALRMYEEDKEADSTILSALETAYNDPEIKKIIDKMQEESNPKQIRDKLLEDLTGLINEDKSLKESGFKYQKAQKALRDAYDLALKEANDLIAKENPSEDEVRKAYKKLLNAKNNLDGDKFDDLKNSLVAKFKQDQLKIKNPEDRKVIAEKINALVKKEATMDDALRVQKELDDLINKSKTVTTTTVAPTTQAPTTQVPTTTRPVSTITNPGSSAKTGINGIAKVAAVAAVAAIILIVTRKKGDKDETNK